MKKYFGNKTFKWLLIALFLAALNLAAVKVYFAVVRTQITDKPVLAHTIKDVPLEYWQKLATKKIFFGHQSVGADIIDGIRKIETEYDFINLHIVEVNETTFGSGPVFLHAAIGHCPDAFSKFSDFEKFMNRLADEKIDIAFMKLCHADIKYEYDTVAIFNAYKKTIAELKEISADFIFTHNCSALLKAERRKNPP